MNKLIILVSLSAVFIVSCVKDRGEVITTGITTDAKLFAFMNAQRFTYYKSDSINKIASISNFHNGNYFLKFNPKAQSALVGTPGKLPAGGTFPDSSLLVKALYNPGGTSPYLYAIMLKNSKSPYANSGWMWAIFNADGSVVNSITQSGSNCVGCHTGGSDNVLTFAAHP